MGRYDKSSKWLIEHHGDSLLRLAGIGNVVAWRPLQAELVQPSQLPDGLLEVTLEGVDEPALFALELATYPERRVATQAARDAGLVWLERGEPPEMLVIVLCPKGNLSVPSFFEAESRAGLTKIHISWRVIELWTLPAEALLAAEDVGLLPWVALTRFDRPAEEVFRECREKIDRLAPPGEHDNILAVTQVLARLRYDDPGLFSMLGGRRAMIESPLLRELEEAAEKRGMDRGMQKGLEKGLEKGLQEGLQQGQREDRMQIIALILEDRFGGAPESVMAAVQGIEDLDRLKDLVRAALHCSTVAEFETELTRSK